MNRWMDGFGEDENFHMCVTVFGWEKSVSHFVTCVYC